MHGRYLLQNATNRSAHEPLLDHSLHEDLADRKECPSSLVEGGRDRHKPNSRRKWTESGGIPTVAAMRLACRSDPELLSDTLTRQRCNNRTLCRLRASKPPSPDARFFWTILRPRRRSRAWTCGQILRQAELHCRSRLP